MNTVCRSLLAGLAMLAGTVAVAEAADLGGSIKDYGAPMPVMSSPVSWYIRSDVGYAFHDDPAITEHTATAEWDLVRNSIGDTWTLGGGIGRYFGSNVRADVTVDYRFKADVKAYNADPAAPFAPGYRRFDLASTVGLLNFYYDFGHRGHFTPYVGAGIGFANNKTFTGTVTDACGCTGTISGKSKTELAAALMAGFSANIRRNMHVDAGYRFLYLGNAETGEISGTAGGVPANVQDPTVHGIIGHEFRVGVRYDLSR
jgi:opacity protein-like surface antigen